MSEKSFSFIRGLDGPSGAASDRNETDCRDQRDFYFDSSGLIWWDGLCDGLTHFTTYVHTHIPDYVQAFVVLRDSSPGTKQPPAGGLS